MAQKRLGVVVSAPDSSAVLTSIANLEQRGIPAAWLTSAGAGAPIPSVSSSGPPCARSACCSGRPSRKPSHATPSRWRSRCRCWRNSRRGASAWGWAPAAAPGWNRPMGSTSAPPGPPREYLRIVETLLHTGSVDFTGRYYKARTRISAPVDVPVMAAALGEKAYELCGAEADGPLAGCALARTCAMSRSRPCTGEPTVPVARCRRWSPMRRVRP